MPVSNEVLVCGLLADQAQQFEVGRDENGLVVQLSGEAPDAICSVVALDIEGKP